MKRFIVIIIPAIVIAVAVVLVMRFEDAPTIPLSTGGTARVLKIAIGPHDLDSIQPYWWESLASKLPGKLRNSLRRILPVLASGGSGRNWMYVPNDTNDLQIYLRLDHSSLLSTGGANNLKALITDADGWVWESHARGYRSFGSSSNQIDVVSLSFAGYPRWEREFEVRLVLDGWLSGNPNVQKIGHFRIKNPEIKNPAKLTPSALPQTAQAGPLTVRLQRIFYSPQPPYTPIQKLKNGELIGGINAVFTTREATDEVVITDAWHEVRKTVVDEYGNNSFYGLPARRPTDVNSPVKAWKFGLELVADQRSQMASNSFFLLAGQPFSENGHLRTETPVVIQKRLTNCVIDAVYVMGAGGVEFTNEVVATNYVVNSSYDGVAESSGSRSASGASGQMIPFIKLESRSPFIVAHVKGVTDGIWFSCRAKNSETGESLWLSQYGPPSESPNFRPLFSQNQLAWWNADKLDTNVVWSFEIGAHFPSRVEFVVDRPKWDPGKAASTEASAK